jgi:capsid protein
MRAARCRPPALTLPWSLSMRRRRPYHAGGQSGRAAAGPVRRRASYYARNSPWIANAVNAIVSGAVGAGIVPQSQHPDPAVRAALQRGWTAWCERADADGVLDFAGMQALAVRTLVETGECFAHYVGTPSGLRVRLLDAEMVPADYSRELDGNARVLQGIELDADGTRAAYHVFRNRPDETTAGSCLSAWKRSGGAQNRTADLGIMSRDLG